MRGLATRPRNAESRGGLGTGARKAGSAAVASIAREGEVLNVKHVLKVKIK